MKYHFPASGRAGGGYDDQICQQELHPAKRKAYQKPTLVKGPLLTKVDRRASRYRQRPADSAMLGRAGSLRQQRFPLDDLPGVARGGRSGLVPLALPASWRKPGRVADRKDRARAVVRAMMMPAVRRKLGI